MMFPSQRSGERALQAVEIVSARRGGDDEGLRPYTFTFCLERVQAGPYKVHASSPLKCMPRHRLHVARAVSAVQRMHLTFWIGSSRSCSVLQIRFPVCSLQNCWMTVGLRVGDYASV